MSYHVQIYANYGVLASEKRTVYTYPEPHENAVSYELISVVIPDTLAPFKTERRTIGIRPHEAWEYDLGEVLTNYKGEPAIRYADQYATPHTYCLRVRTLNEIWYDLNYYYHEIEQANHPDADKAFPCQVVLLDVNKRLFQRAYDEYKSRGGKRDLSKFSMEGFTR
jgi:hypothetical protein